MTVTLLDLSTTKDFVSRLDDNPENPTVWKLGALDAFQWAEIQDFSVPPSFEETEESGGGPRLTVAHRMLLMVRYGLKDVHNLPGHDFKKETIFRNGIQREVVSYEFLRQLPSDLILELAAELHNLNDFSEDQAKN